MTSALQAVLLLAPSRGMGGGIERYVETLAAAFEHHQVPYVRLDLRHPGSAHGPRAKLRFLAEARRAVRTSSVPMRVVVAHRNLLPVLRSVRRAPQYRGTVVVLHGNELWSRRHQRHASLLRRRDVQTAAVSNYSAGAAASLCPATVLHPGVSHRWYRTLTEQSAQSRPARDEVRLVTAFRLTSWREKGLDTVIEAVRRLRDDRVRLTICGTGGVPADLRERVAAHPWCRLAPDLTDQALAHELADADLCVLGTRTRGGKRASGEGFGMTLLEAQLAGTPVVAPAYGGSGDAYQPGLTGVAPVDESPEALAAALGPLVADASRREQYARAAAIWAQNRFDPAVHSELVVTTLLGGVAPATPVVPAPASAAEGIHILPSA